MDNELCKTKNGYAKETKKCDEKNNIVEIAYFDVNDKLTYSQDRGWGFAKIITKYNEKGQAIEHSFYDTDEKRCADASFVSVYQHQYDEKGNLSDMHCYDTQNKFIIHIKYHYNELGQRDELSYYDSNGKLYPHHGYAKCRYYYNERGFLIEAHYYDEKDEICFIPNGYAIYQNKYDKYGNVIEQSYWDKNNNLCLHTTYKYAVYAVQYDRYGNLIEQAFYDTNRKLTIYALLNCAKEKRYYNNRGQLIKIDKYDEKENLLVPQQNNNVSTERKTFITGIITDASGSVYLAGYRNDIFIFEYNDWNVYQDLDKFKEALFKSADTTKRIVFIDQKDMHIEEQTFGAGVLGVRFMDYETSDIAFYNKYIQIYEKWKRDKKQTKL